MINDNIDEKASERIFYNLLLRVGAIGKYQYINLVIWGTIYMISGSITLFNPFLLYQTPYKCIGFTENECFDIVCSLPQHIRSNYINKQHQTLLDMFGDHRCSDPNLGKNMQAIIYIAGFIGLLFGTYLNTYIRKKLLVQLVLIISIFCITLSLFVTKLSLIIIFFSINYICHLVIIDLAVCFFAQTVIEQERGAHVMILFIFYSIGTTFNGIFFKYLHWRQVFIFYLIIPLIIMTLGLIFHVKQTPFDLITNFTPQQTLKDLRWIAQQNGNGDSHQITVKQLTNIQIEYNQCMKKKNQLSFSMVDLFRYKSLRLDVICCCIFHFFIFFNYCAPLLALDQFSSDIYLIDVIFSLATLISAVGSYYMIDDLPRKKTVYYSMALTLLLIIPSYFASNCGLQCHTIKTIQTISMFLFRMSLQVTYQIFYLIQNEVFPTQIRSFAVLLTAIMGNLVQVFVPLVAQLNEKNRLVLPTFILVSGIIVVASTVPLPETLGIPPPEIIEQLALKLQKDTSQLKK